MWAHRLFDLLSEKLCLFQILEYLAWLNFLFDSTKSKRSLVLYSFEHIGLLTCDHISDALLMRSLIHQRARHIHLQLLSYKSAVVMNGLPLCLEQFHERLRVRSLLVHPQICGVAVS